MNPFIKVVLLLLLVMSNVIGFAHASNSEVAKRIAPIITFLLFEDDVPAHTINSVNDFDLAVSGTGAPGATINVTSDSLPSLVCDNAPVIVDTAGVWVCDFTQSNFQAAGTVISATQVVNNAAESDAVSTTVTAVPILAAPVVNPIEHMLLEFSGEGMPGATIEFLPGSTVPLCSDPVTLTVSPVVVGSDGVWTCVLTTNFLGQPITPLVEGQVITAIQVLDGFIDSPSASQTVEGDPTCEYEITVPVTGATTTENGAWPDEDLNGDCISETRFTGFGDHLSAYYQFSLTAPTQMQISLNSTGTSPYLYLYNGFTRSGNIVQEVDGSGSSNAQTIFITLSAGDYTIEATTSFEEETGDFTVSIERP